MINSVDEENVFDKFQYYFMIKTFNGLGIEGTFYKVKTIYDIPIANIIHSE